LVASLADRTGKPAALNASAVALRVSSVSRFSGIADATAKTPRLPVHSGDGIDMTELAV
jgi:hypothetical protein